MKRILLIVLSWLAYLSSYAQNNDPNLNLDSKSITTTRISLPQLITTKLNRTKLQYKIDLSEGLKNPNLSVNYQKFLSDKSKQFTLNGGINLSQSFSFNRNDNRDFYTILGTSAELGADLKLFNKNDYFLQFGTQNSLSKIGGISEFNFINTYNSFTIGFGKGRINFSNDGASALAITDKLAQFGLLKRDLNDEEYQQLVEKIKNLKNRRKFVNRSYPLSEAEEIHELLKSFDIIKEGINTMEIINSEYQFEPMFDRTSGSQFSVSATGSYTTSNFITNYNNVGLGARIAYETHTPLNSKWQYNRTFSGYLFMSDNQTSDPSYVEDKLKRAGLSISNDFHYFVDTKIRYSVYSKVGYDFKNKYGGLTGSGIPYRDQKGSYLDIKGELQYQISRKMSTTFGINLNLNPYNNYTGLKLGLNF